MQLRPRSSKPHSSQLFVIGVWILALSSAFMYISRYAINEWGLSFYRKPKATTWPSAAIIGINPIFGIIGTVFSGWLSDAIFKGNRNYPAFAAGVLEAIALALFLFGGPGKVINIIAMVLFGIAIGVLVSFIGGLMAVDLVPRKASGAAVISFLLPILNWKRKKQVI